MALLSPLLPAQLSTLAADAANDAAAAASRRHTFSLPLAIDRLWLAVVTVVPLGVESAVRYRGDILHPNTRERSCDLVAFATLATLAAAAAACVILAV